MRRLAFILLIFSFFSLVAYVFLRPDEYLHVIQCDVGQGDALLIEYGTQQMLIDQGPDDSVLSCLEQNLPFWDRTIEVVIVTHADQDHLGGLDEVIESYGIEHLFMNPTDKQTQTIKKLQSIIEDHQIEQEELYLGDSISLKSKKGDVEFVAVSPDQRLMQACGYVADKPEQEKNTNKSDCYKEYIDENNRSISGELRYGNFTLLSLGDVESVIEQSVVPSLMTKDVDVLKVSHHGSKFSTSSEFIKAITPEIALISVGQNNRFGHPTTRVIDTLRSSNIKILRTDELGDVEIVSNGKEYWIK